jgi:hypothetical protein
MYIRQIITGMCIAAWLCPAAMQAQRITKTEAEAIDGKIRVTCELQTNTYQDLFLSCSEDNGQSFFPCRSVTGDLVNQLSGPKVLIWDCAKDDVIMGNFIFRVTYIPSSSGQTERKTEQKKTTPGKTEKATAKPSPRDSAQRTVRSDNGATEKKSGGFFLMPGVSMGSVMSYSLMAGYAGTWGGYAKVKSNLASGGEFVTEGSSDMYFDGNYVKTGRFSASAGLVKSLSNTCFLYAGIGYGNRWVQWKALNGQFVEIEDHSFSGIDPEVGILLKIQRFTIGGGGNCLSGKRSVFEANISIGFIF